MAGAHADHPDGLAPDGCAVVLVSDVFTVALGTKEARAMLLEAKAYTHGLPETLMIGAQHLLNWLEVKATAAERAKHREPVKPAKGVPRG